MYSEYFRALHCLQLAPSERLQDRVVGVGGHAALVAALGHLDVAVHAPGGAPGVLDDPVVLAAVGTVADGQHSVVQVAAAAVGLVVDAARVQLERVVAGVDADGDGADVADGVLHVVLVVLDDLHPGGHGGDDLALVEAPAVEVSRRMVRVVSLRHQTANVDQVVVGARLEAAVAAKVAVPEDKRRIVSRLQADCSIQV